MLKYTPFYLVIFLISACSAPAPKKNSHPIIGQWDLGKTCKKPVTLTSKHQVQGAVFGTWEERPSIIELNLAQNINGSRQYTQLLLTKPKNRKMQILRVIQPFGKTKWKPQRDQIIKKCAN